MSSNSPIRSILAIAALAVAAAACAPGPEPTPEKPTPRTPEALFQAGKYDAAAEALARLAEQAGPAKAARLRYRRGQALALAGRDVKALSILRALSGTPEAQRAALLRARIHLRHRHLAQARSILERLASRTGDLAALPVSLREEVQDYLAQVHLMEGRPGDGFDALVDRHRLLEGEAVREGNIARIRYMLGSMPERKLAERIEAAGEEFPGGYLRFEQRMRQATRQPLARTQEDLRAWLDRYPDHPLADIVRARLQRVQEVPVRVAVLLPMGSRYRPLAEAILHGMLAAYYRTDRTAGIRVDILDTGGTARGARTALDRIRGESYTAVIGPLTQPAVKALTGSMGPDSDLPPTLILNTTGDWASAGPNIFQLGLDPEEEARQVAEYSYRTGYRQAGLLYPDSDWGRRMVAAFQERWAELGGGTRAIRAFDPEDRDHSGAIKALLALDEVTQRRKALQATLGVSLPEYETPPRREDLDFLFLASETLSARLIKPQLEFYAAGDLPVLTTSHVHSPDDSASDRRDMNGIRFLQLPWFLEPRPEHQGAERALEASYSAQEASLERLNALGYDAYTLMVGAWRRSLLLEEPMLVALREIRLAGGTGRLSADPDGRVRRRLQWAEYRNGRIIPLPGMLVPGK